MMVLSTMRMVTWIAIVRLTSEEIDGECCRGSEIESKQKGKISVILYNFFREGVFIVVSGMRE